MGDAAGQLAQALQSLGLELAPFGAVAFGLDLESFAFLLGLDPIGDIADGGRDEQPVRCLDRPEADVGGELRAVAAAGRELGAGSHGPGSGGGEVRLATPRMAVGGVVRDEDLDRLAQQFVAPVPEQRLDLGVDQHDGAGPVDADDGVGCELQQRPHQ